MISAIQNSLIPGLKFILIAFTAFSWTACQDAENEGEGGCRALESGAAGSLSRMVPGDHRIIDRVAMDYPDRVRAHDQASVTVAGGRIVRESGEVRYGTPGLWIIEGGTKREHETYPKGYYPLNAAAMQAAEDMVAGLDEATRSRRRAIRPATALNPPYSPDDSVAGAVLGCIAAGATEAQ